MKYFLILVIALVSVDVYSYEDAFTAKCKLTHDGGTKEFLASSPNENFQVTEEFKVNRAKVIVTVVKRDGIAFIDRVNDTMVSTTFGLGIRQGKEQVDNKIMFPLLKEENLVPTQANQNPVRWSTCQLADTSPSSITHAGGEPITERALGILRSSCASFEKNQKNVLSAGIIVKGKPVSVTCEWPNWRSR